MFKLNDKQRYALVGIALVAILCQLATNVRLLFQCIKLLFNETTEV